MSLALKHEPSSPETSGADPIRRQHRHRRWWIVIVALVGVVLAGVVIAGATRPCPLWKSTVGAPLPLARWGSAVAVIDGRLLVFGGWTGPDLRATRRVDAYDPALDRWTRLADLPEPITHVVPVCDGRTIWFVGGFRGDKGRYVTIDHVWKYDVDADTWSPGPPLPAPRSGGGTVRIGRTLHYYGGYGPDLETGSGRHWSLALDDARGWVERAPMPIPRGHLSGTVVSGVAYAIGGEIRHDQSDVRYVHAYDPARDAWRRVADLPTPRSHIEPSTIVLGDRIVVMGGCDNAGWRALEHLERSRWGAVLARVPERLWFRLIPSLRRCYAVDEVTVYDVARDRWSRLPRLPERLLAPTAALVGDRLIVTGGSRAGWWEPRAVTYVGKPPRRSDR
jgi:N-acetylneuraminic acid mutarotase